MTDFIVLKWITKTYGWKDMEPVHALRGVDLVIKDWDFTAIMGPSGCWKSTLMNIVWLLDVPSEWKYILRGEEVKHLNTNQQSLIRRNNIGFIFQWYNLLKRICAREQVALPLSYMWISPSQAKKRSFEALEMVWLKWREKAMPNQLSGWQQQRVCIARALVTNAGLILADEPTWALDSNTWLELMELFKKLNAEQKRTILLITHDANVASFAKNIIHMKDGQFDQ